MPRRNSLRCCLASRGRCPVPRMSFRCSKTCFAQVSRNDAPAEACSVSQAGPSCSLWTRSDTLGVAMPSAQNMPDWAWYRVYKCHRQSCPQAVTHKSFGVELLLRPALPSVQRVGT